MTWVKIAWAFFKASRAAQIAAGVAALLGAFFIWLAVHDRHVIEKDVAKSNSAFQQRDRASGEKADAERAVDDQRIAGQSEAYNAVIAANPGGTLPHSTVALNCERLRRAGKDAGWLPPCTGYAGSDQGKARSAR